MRIGLSTTTIEPALTQGKIDGIGVYTRALLQGLPEHGCDVTGFAYPPPAGAGNGGDIRFTSGQPMAHSYPASTLLDLFTPDSRRKKMPVDLFHATDYRIIRMDCPVVATLHDAIPLKYPHWCSPRLRRLKNMLLQRAAKNADHVIAVSEYAVAELVECFGIDQRNITVVHNGVGQEWLAAPEPAAVSGTLLEYGLRAGYYLFVGTLQPRKNVERILAAYRQLPPAIRAERQLVIVGHAGWQCDDLVRQLRAAQQQGENVLWLDNVGDSARLRQLYAGAGAFVFPSLYEGFGIPVAEAFAAGVPVITSNTTSLPEVSQGAALEIDPLSVADIGAAMQALAQDDALRARCIEGGRKRAATLSWETTASRTADVYRRFL
ncbi:MAG: glycosyltransferase [Burkholderiaceae bacterium]|nr:glycosyltransferase [Burkholderiaceae bacterium]